MSKRFKATQTPVEGHELVNLNAPREVSVGVGSIDYGGSDLRALLCVYVGNSCNLELQIDRTTAFDLGLRLQDMARRLDEKVEARNAGATIPGGRSEMAA